ncbi:head-tail connector protein [Rhodobacter sp. NSM]|uniref:head-tail connector protein n=1 Tax=Rhodobacter sp. NSM TaxID=3457501 RepID=UPI003FD342E6
MMLIEQTPVPDGSLPIAEMKEHLRLGSGFADEGLQDGLLARVLRAAMTSIEGRTGKVLLSHRFLMVLDDWRTEEAQALPVAPVSEVVSVTLVDGAERMLPVAPSLWRLVRDQHRPKLMPRVALLPTVPDDGRIEILFEAGFGPRWSDIPSDLSLAVMLLAAEFYENRYEPGTGGGGLPVCVTGLIERWRTVRVLGGGAA